MWLFDAATTIQYSGSKSHKQCDGRQPDILCVRTEPAPVAEGTEEAAADGDASPVATPPAEDAAEVEEYEEGPPKPDYSTKMLEYVVASSGQVSTSAHARQTSCSKRMPPT